ncbi:uncharacterized protein LOC116434593 isoform X1 [Nomia melanderi]|uniref:uncharacterized protein LOC116434593 isoform X1 n=1 Tax=Nomia melanderi TaxID=2448451 RepID=UPI003FCE99A0
MQKQYKSPLPWYNIVADMLKKVINDEEKVNSVAIVKSVPPDTSVLKSLSSDNIHYPRQKDDKLRISPCTNETCNAVTRRSRSARSSIKFTSSTTTDTRSNMRTKYILCPQARNTSVARQKNGSSNYKPRKNINSAATVIDPAKESTKKYEPPFLKCPSCGWKHTKYKTIENNVENSKQEQRVVTPYVNSYNDSPNLKYTPCSGCIKGISYYNYIDVRIILMYLCNTIILLDITRCSNHAKMYADDSGDFVHVKDLHKSTALSSAPTTLPKLNVGVQTIESSQTQVVQLDPTVTNIFEGGIIEANTRFKIILPDSKTGSGGNTVGTQSVCQCTQGVQCLKPELCTKETQLSPKFNANDTCTNTVTSREWGTQCTICISNKISHCASTQTLDRTKEKQSGVHSAKQSSKDLVINKENQAAKEIQCTICISRGNLTRSSSFEKMKDIGTTSSVHKIHSKDSITPRSFKSICIGGQCIPPTRAKSHGSVKRRIRHKDCKEVATGETEVYTKSCNTETCPRNVSELMKEPTVTSALQQLLYKMLSFKLNRVSQCVKSQTDYEQKKYSVSCATDTTEMVNKIKELAMTVMETSVSKDESIQTLVDAETPNVCVNKLTMTKEDLYKPIYQCTGVQGDGTGPISPLERSVTDKGICTHCECRDIGINGSLLQTCNAAVQNDLDNSLCSNNSNMDKQKKITVGTQKRDPILVRVIKCTENQTTKKSNKETLTTKTDDELEMKSSNKRIKACDRFTCIPYTVCRRSKQEESLNQEEHKYHVNCDYRERSYVDPCDDKCKNKLHQDWTNIMNVDAFNNIHSSKIPLCMKPTRKCTFARSK